MKFVKLFFLLVFVTFVHESNGGGLARLAKQLGKIVQRSIKSGLKGVSKNKKLIQGLDDVLARIAKNSKDVEIVRSKQILTDFAKIFKSSTSKQVKKQTKVLQKEIKKGIKEGKKAKQELKHATKELENLNKHADKITDKLNKATLKEEKLIQQFKKQEKHMKNVPNGEKYVKAEKKFIKSKDRLEKQQLKVKKIKEKNEKEWMALPDKAKKVEDLKFKVNQFKTAKQNAKNILKNYKNEVKELKLNTEASRIIRMGRWKAEYRIKLAETKGAKMMNKAHKEAEEMRRQGKMEADNIMKKAYDDLKKQNINQQSTKDTILNKATIDAASVKNKFDNMASQHILQSKREVKLKVDKAIKRGWTTQIKARNKANDVITEQDIKVRDYFAMVYAQKKDTTIYKSQDLFEKSQRKSKLDDPKSTSKVFDGVHDDTVDLTFYSVKSRQDWMQSKDILSVKDKMVKISGSNYYDLNHWNDVVNSYNKYSHKMYSEGDLKKYADWDELYTKFANTKTSRRTGGSWEHDYTPNAPWINCNQLCRLTHKKNQLTFTSLPALPTFSPKEVKKSLRNFEDALGLRDVGRQARRGSEIDWADVESRYIKLLGKERADKFLNDPEVIKGLKDAVKYLKPNHISTPISTPIFSSLSDVTSLSWKSGMTDEMSALLRTNSLPNLHISEELSIGSAWKISVTDDIDSLLRTRSLSTSDSNIYHSMAGGNRIYESVDSVDSVLDYKMYYTYRHYKDVGTSTTGLTDKKFILKLPITSLSKSQDELLKPMKNLKDFIPKMTELKIGKKFSTPAPITNPSSQAKVVYRGTDYPFTQSEKNPNFISKIFSSDTKVAVKQFFVEIGEKFNNIAPKYKAAKEERKVLKTNFREAITRAFRTGDEKDIQKVEKIYEEIIKKGIDHDSIRKIIKNLEQVDMLRISTMLSKDKKADLHDLLKAFEIMKKTDNGCFKKIRKVIFNRKRINNVIIGALGTTVGGIVSHVFYKYVFGSENMTTAEILKKLEKKTLCLLTLLTTKSNETTTTKEKIKNVAGCVLEEEGMTPLITIDDFLTNVTTTLKDGKKILQNLTEATPDVIINFITNVTTTLKDGKEIFKNLTKKPVEKTTNKNTPEEIDVITPVPLHEVAVVHTAANENTPTETGTIVPLSKAANENATTETVTNEKELFEDHDLGGATTETVTNEKELFEDYDLGGLFEDYDLGGAIDVDVAVTEDVLDSIKATVEEKQLHAWIEQQFLEVDLLLDEYIENSVNDILYNFEEPEEIIKTAMDMVNDAQKTIDDDIETDDEEEIEEAKTKAKIVVTKEISTTEKITTTKETTTTTTEETTTKATTTITTSYIKTTTTTLTTSYIKTTTALTTNDYEENEDADGLLQKHKNIFIEDFPQTISFFKPAEYLRFMNCGHQNNNSYFIQTLTLLFTKITSAWFIF